MSARNGRVIVEMDFAEPADVGDDEGLLPVPQAASSEDRPPVPTSATAVPPF
jgi:hypothetical protein